MDFFHKINDNIYKTLFFHDLIIKIKGKILRV